MIYFKNTDIKYPLFENNFFKQKIISFFKYQKIDNKTKYIDVLNNISLDIVKGDKVALIGNNGSGKTTF